MSALAISARAGWKFYAAAERVWSRLWFQERSTTPLELMRIGIGAALLLYYLRASLICSNSGETPACCRARLRFGIWTRGCNLFSSISRRHGNGSPLMCCFCSVARPSSPGGERPGSNGSSILATSPSSTATCISSTASTRFCRLCCLSCVSHRSGARSASIGARRAAYQARAPRCRAATIHQPLGRRLHTAHTNSDGSAVLL